RLSRIFRTLTQPGSSHLASATAKNGLDSTAASKKWRRLILPTLTDDRSLAANTWQVYHILGERRSSRVNHSRLLNREFQKFLFELHASRLMDFTLVVRISQPSWPQRLRKPVPRIHPSSVYS